MLRGSMKRPASRQRSRNDKPMATRRDEVQDDLFPELDPNKQKEKAVLLAAKKFNKAKSERDELLSTAKEKVDNRRAELIGLMHEAKIEKFRYEGVTCEIIPGEEKVQVKIASDDTDVDESDNDE